MLIVDLSNNNPEPDWHVLAGTVDAVWLKASQGLHFTDPCYASWSAAARGAGLRVGAYHFCQADENADGAGEARHFASVVGTIHPTDLRPVLDYERTRPDHHDHAWIISFNRETLQRLGTGPLFYSYPALITGLELPHPVGYGLWLASYSRDDGLEHPFTVPAPWKHAAAHQFTSAARVPGCPAPVDLSRALNEPALLAHPLARSTR